MHTPEWGGNKGELRTQLSSEQNAAHRHHTHCLKALCMVPCEEKGPCRAIRKDLEVDGYHYPVSSQGLLKREAGASESEWILRQKQTSEWCGVTSQRQMASGS